MDRTRPRTDGLAKQIDQLRPTVDDGMFGVAQWERTSSILDRFGRFATEGCGLVDLAEVTSGVARSFVTAPMGTGRGPSTSTMHWRRTALRLLFRAARRRGLVDGDPTLDLELPPRSSLGTRPLTDDEVLLCRSVAQWSLGGSRRAAAWALAEATCRSSELPSITGDGVDLDSGRVWIAGGKSTEPRASRLTEWGLVQVRARLEELEAPSLPLVYSGRSPTGAGQVSGAAAIVDVLTRAGLHQEPDVRPIVSSARGTSSPNRPVSSDNRSERSSPTARANSGSAAQRTIVRFERPDTSAASR